MQYYPVHDHSQSHDDWEHVDDDDIQGTSTC